MTEETIAAWVRWLRDPNRSYNPNAYELLADVLEKAAPAGGVQALSAVSATFPSEMETAVAMAINSAIYRIKAGNTKGALEPLEDAKAMLAASPTPPAEQPSATPKAALTAGAAPVVKPGAVYAKLPEALLVQYDEVDGEEFGCFAEAQMRDFADRTHALRQADQDYSEKWDAVLGRAAMRFVDRAGDVHPCIDDAETICAEFYKAMSEVIERMPHVQRMAAPKAAPGEPVASAAQAAPQQEAQEPDPATFALWYADHIGDDNKPVREAAWETYQAFAGKAAAPQAAPAVDDDLWYLQDTRSYVGNDVLWWAKDGNGYTTDVSKAHVYNRAEAFRQAAMRGTDRAWPKAYIDSKTRPAVDMQYINHDAALTATSNAR